jgi:hypothetical protein
MLQRIREIGSRRKRTPHPGNVDRLRPEQKVQCLIESASVKGGSEFLQAAPASINKLPGDLAASQSCSSIGHQIADELLIALDESDTLDIGTAKNRLHFTEARKAKAL